MRGERGGEGERQSSLLDLICSLLLWYSRTTYKVT